jgi:alkylation response protein AidB-like acyl-CoA dehydrogenase
MVGPTLIAHGSDEQKKRFLDGMLRGDDIWCQLFSEPGAGSDLASLGTRAVRDGDEWVVNGQKVWNSYAHQADWGALIARTDPDAPKHRGITFFLVDMRTPGIEVRPLRQITGVAHFNEVFLNDVRIPADAVVGEVNDGWRVAQTMLISERTLIGGGHGQYTFADILELADRRGRRLDPLARQDLARAYTRMEILRYLGLRVQSAISQGRMPGPESSVMKLFISRHHSMQGDLVMALDGANGTLWGKDGGDDSFWQNVFLNQWASKIGGGTDQIQGNIIGERVLGLPREPGDDRDTPWRDLAKG